jgi:type VI secretion system protein ImpH
MTDEVWHFSFFQAVRLLQLAAPERAAVGVGDDPTAEAVRFSSNVSLAFPSSEIQELRPGAAADDPVGLVVNFMGLATPASYGSLPMPYTELILERGRSKNNALRDFVDLFNHRLVSLFYRAWEKNRFGITYEREGSTRRGLFEQAMFGIMGLGTPSLQRGLSVNPRALLARAYAVGGRGISALALASLIGDYFGVRAAVEQFIPAWYAIEDNEICRLGVQSCHLGQDLCLGARTRMAQSRFRVCLGPLSWRRLAEFLPLGTAFGTLSEFCTLASGPHFDFEFKLELAAGQTPALALGVADDQGAPRLGWSSWLRRDDGDARPTTVTVDGTSTGLDLPLGA